MKHPIHKKLPKYEIGIVKKCIDGDVKPEEVYGIVDKKVEDVMGFLDNNKKNLIKNISTLRVVLTVSIVSNGLIYIDATTDRWDSDISENTISKIEFSKIKFPFVSGSVNLHGETYLFASEENRLLIVAADAEELLNSDDNGGIIFASIGNGSEHATVEELIDSSIERGEINESSKSRIYSLISIFMFIAMYDGDDRYVKKKKIKSGKLSRNESVTGLKRDDIHVINVKQGFSYEKSNSLNGNSASSKSWIVRGHWRNQHYKDGARLKWIKPFWKGVGKEVINKVYKV